MLSDYNNEEEFYYNGWHCVLTPDGKRYLCSKDNSFKLILNKKELLQN